MLLGALSFVLLALDSHYQALDTARYTVSTLATPLYWVTDLSTRITGWIGNHGRSRAELLKENTVLHAELLVLEGKAQKMASLAAENIRLRELLNSSALIDDGVLVAELIGVSPDPSTHEVIVNKGEPDGVYVGQPLIDAQGLMGQVIEVSRYSSRAILITDVTHAIPIQVNRNGVRAIAEGTGLLDELRLKHVAVTTDIQPGDLLVSSGLGGVFPVGYPVATVDSVEHDPGQPFLQVIARPNAKLNRTRHVLLVFRGVNQNNKAERERKPEAEPESEPKDAEKASE